MPSEVRKLSRESCAESESEHFRHYSLNHRVVSWVSRNLFDNFSYTVRHGLMRGLKRKGGLGWVPSFLSRSIETAEYRFWRGYQFSGLTVYDVGSFEGLLASFLASRAENVVCYEPNDRNHTRLMANLALNGFRNVTVRKIGVGEAAGRQELVWNPEMPGGASIETATADHLRTTAAAQKQIIAITTIDRDVDEAGLPAPDFVKIDIEGWELPALRGACRTLNKYRPALFLEMHGETMADKKQKVAAIVDFLVSIGYPEIRHIESGQQITASNSEIAVEGHLYCPRY